ncbi:MAG TPA: hypothetical protein VGK73_17560 [Polyangiaceae bacterium]
MQRIVTFPKPIESKVISGEMKPFGFVELYLDCIFAVVQTYPKTEEAAELVVWLAPLLRPLKGDIEKQDGFKLTVDEDLHKTMLDVLNIGGHLPEEMAEFVARCRLALMKAEKVREKPVDPKAATASNE